MIWFKLGDVVRWNTARLNEEHRERDKRGTQRGRGRERERERRKRKRRENFFFLGVEIDGILLLSLNFRDSIDVMFMSDLGLAVSKGDHAGLDADGL